MRGVWTVDSAGMQVSRRCCWRRPDASPSKTRASPSKTRASPNCWVSSPSAQTTIHPPPPASGPSTPSRRRQSAKASPARRPPPPQIDHHEQHRFDVCPDCGGPLQRCTRTRTRTIEDVLEDIRTIVTEHTVHRDYCPACKKHVEPVVPDALPKAALGHRVVTLSSCNGSADTGWSRSAGRICRGSWTRWPGSESTMRREPFMSGWSDMTTGRSEGAATAPWLKPLIEKPAPSRLDIGGVCLDTTT